MRVAGWIVLCGWFCTGTLYADFSYQQTGQVTGGALAAMMKFASAFSKQAREPMVTHIYVKGHRIAHINQHSAEITDVDKETITNINFDRKTYTVITFDQMKQQLEQMSKQAQSKPEQNADLHMNVSVKNTGQTKDVAGLSAKELVLTMSVQGTDPQSGQSGSMDIRSDMWMAPVEGYEEVRQVYRLMGEKLGFVMGGNFLPMQRPDLVKDMGELYKEMEKVEGMPVETVVSMGGSGTPAGSSANASSNSAPPTAANSGSEDSAKSQSASDAAVGAAMARLGGLTGGFGGFGHRKKKAAPENESQPQQQQQSSQQQNQSASAEAPQGSNGGGTLLEMTTHASDFSTAAVDESRFAVPDGFKQVEPDENRRGRQ